MYQKIWQPHPFYRQHGGILQNRESTVLFRKHGMSGFAQRLRGALAAERTKHGDQATILLPMLQTWRPAILAMLNSNPQPEEIISSTGPSEQLEEEE